MTDIEFAHESVRLIQLMHPTHALWLRVAESIQSEDKFIAECIRFKLREDSNEQVQDYVTYVLSRTMSEATLLELAKKINSCTRLRSILSRVASSTSNTCLRNNLHVLVNEVNRINHTE